jgi:hypothetical protein
MELFVLCLNQILLVGTLTSLTLSGAISGVTTLTATLAGGTITTAAQPNTTSVGSSSLSMGEKYLAPTY